MTLIALNPHLANEVQKWLIYLQKNLNYSEKTIEAYRHNVIYFIQFMNQLKHQSLTFNDIMTLKLNEFRHYLDHRKNHDLIIQRSLTRNLSAIKNFFAYQERHTGLKNDDLAHLTVSYKNRLLPKPIEQEDLFNILEYLKDNSDDRLWMRLRNYVVAIILYGAGLRISEALSLSFRDVTSDAMYLKITGKGSRVRHVPYTEIMRAAIMDYIQECPYQFSADDKIFVGVKGGVLNKKIYYNVLQQAYHYLNIPYGFSAHSFRHSCASHLLNDGANLRTIQSLMGHKRLSATENYLKVNHNHLRNIIAKAHPRNS